MHNCHLHCCSLLVQDGPTSDVHTTWRPCLQLVGDKAVEKLIMIPVTHTQAYTHVHTHTHTYTHNADVSSMPTKQCDHVKVADVLPVLSLSYLINGMVDGGPS